MTRRVGEGRGADEDENGKAAGTQHIWSIWSRSSDADGSCGGGGIVVVAGGKIGFRRC